MSLGRSPYRRAVGRHSVTSLVGAGAAGGIFHCRPVALVAPPPPPPGTFASSVTQYGVTWTFDQPYQVGQFINGDPWVMPLVPGGAVNVVSRTPGLSGSGATLRNGMMVNPSSEIHGYDGRATNFSATATGANPTLPYAATAGKSLVATVSLASLAGTGPNGTFLDRAVVLTVVASVPPADAFRPPCCGTYKPIFTQSQLLTGLLPSLPPVSVAGPTLPNVEARFQQVQLDHSWNTSTAGRPSPLASFHAFGNVNSSHVYGELLAIDNGEAILRTFQNDSVAAKLKSVTNLVQAGIDWYGVAKAGINVAGSSGGGGHMGGRKIMAAYAGWLLNDSDIKSVAGSITGGGFGETLHYYWSSAIPGTHFVGQPAGGALFGNPNTFGKPFPYAGVGGKEIKDPLGFVDASLTTHDAPTVTNPNGVLGGIPAATATYHGGLYIDIASSDALLTATICSIVPALRTIFNHDPEIFYADRVWDFGMWTQPDGSPGRDLGAPVRALHGTLSHGALIAAGYGSAYGNAMRTAYRGASTFTG